MEFICYCFQFFRCDIIFDDRAEIARLTEFNFVRIVRQFANPLVEFILERDRIVFINDCDLHKIFYPHKKYNSFLLTMSALGIVPCYTLQF